jgi:hypothetical protein
MSRPKNDQPETGPVENSVMEPDGELVPAKSEAGPEVPKEAPQDLTIEELAACLKVPLPILTAVMQAEEWGGGKRLPKEAFQRAVDAFLKGPASGKKAVKVKGEKNGVA